MEIIGCKNLTQKPSEREKERMEERKKNKNKEGQKERKKEKMTILFHVTKCRI